MIAISEIHHQEQDHRDTHRGEGHSRILQRSIMRAFEQHHAYDRHPHPSQLTPEEVPGRAKLELRHHR